MSVELSPQDFADWSRQKHAARQQAYVLDVRESWELDSASVVTLLEQMGVLFQHIPLSEIYRQLDSLPPKNTPVAILCHHGRRSTVALQTLKLKGFTQLYNISGGIAAWADLVPEIGRY